MEETQRQINIAWAAGLFEGEGCLSVQNWKGTKKFITQLTSTDEDVLLRFAEIVGKGKIYGPYTQGEHKTKWVWNTSRLNDFKYVVDLFFEFMGERRRTRALELVDEWVAYTSRVHLKQSRPRL